MDWLFRRHFWVMHVLCLALCAFIVAKAISAIVGFEFQKLFVVPPKIDIPMQQIEPTARRNFSDSTERNIFQAKREAITNIDINNLSKSPTRAGRWQDAVKSDSGFRLIGTAVFSDPKCSLATIVESAASDTAAPSYSINACPTGTDELGAAAIGEMTNFMKPITIPCNKIGPGATVIRIEKSRVYFFSEKTGQYEYLELEGSGPLAIKSARTTYTPPSSTKSGSNIKQVGVNSFQIARDEFDRSMSNLSQIATQARVVPVIEDGKTLGFKIFQIQPGSIFSGLGLKDGDLIRSINDYALDSPDKALELYSKLKTTSSFNIDIDRNVLPTSLDYSVTP